jgi:hypothetical protein
MLPESGTCHTGVAGDPPEHLPSRFDQPMPLVRLMPNGTIANRDARCRMVVLVRCRWPSTMRCRRTRHEADSGGLRPRA